AEVGGQLIAKDRQLPALLRLRDALRAGVDDRNVLLSAACAGALADAGDSASIPLLVRAYATRGHDADADARIGIRDALRALAGPGVPDGLGGASPAPAPPASRDEAFFARPSFGRAILHTTAGDIEWRFFADEAPQTVKNFIRLAEKGYFDSLRVHRVVPD